MEKKKKERIRYPFCVNIFEVKNGTIINLNPKKEIFMNEYFVKGTRIN